MRPRPTGYGPVEYLTRRPFDYYRDFLSQVPRMANLARVAASTEAHSYRDFHVGACVYAVNPSTQEINIHSAGNVRRKVKSKVCAEKISLGRVSKEGLTHAVGIIVVGITDPKEIAAVTGRPTPTLHLCSDCRNFTLHDSPLVHDHTLIVSTGIDSDVNQTFTFGQLEIAYAPDQPDGEYDTAIDLMRANADFSDWTKRIEEYDRIASLAPSRDDIMMSYAVQLALAD